MPWRRRSRFMDELAKRLNAQEGKPPLTSLQVLGAVELLLEKVWALTKLIAWMLVVLFVVLVGTAVVANRANRSSTKVSNFLDTVNTPANNAEANAARERIKRIEQAVCGGPCPTLPVEEKK